MKAAAPLSAVLALSLTACASSGTRAARGQADALDARAELVASGPAADAIAAELSPPAQAATSRITYTETRRERHTARDSTTPPPTFGQRVSAWLAGLSTLAIVAIVLLAVFCPGVLVAFLLRTALRWKRAFSETVAAVSLSGALGRDEKLHDALKAAQSPDTRELVTRAKRDA